MRILVALCVIICIGHNCAFAQLPAGSVALYPLDNSTANDLSSNGYNGTLTATSNTANRFGAANRATAFVAGTSTGTLPSGLVTALANDFTVAYWVKTTMTAPTSTQWYSGTALVDAEVCGVTNDWGTALINGGKIAFGLGNPDITIISPLSYNDGSWHFVTATRAAAAGVITLYVDGSQVATTSGTGTAARTAPPLIGLGRNPCAAAGVFTGSLDDIIAYNSTLTPTQVANLFTYYSAVPLPIHWGAFTGEVIAGTVLLTWTTENSSQDVRFMIGRSAPGGAFANIGEVPAADGTPAAGGSATYRFADAHPASGNNFYRIEGTAVDGTSSWTTILGLTVTAADNPGIRLQANPVAGNLGLINTSGAIINRIQLFDVAGRVLQDHSPNSGNSLLELPTSGLKAGYYFLRIGQPGNMITIPFLKL